MAIILLVHGSWHGGWVWDDIAARLSSTHQVLAPSLRGLGEEAANLRANIGLWTHVDELETLIIERDLKRLLLVGHSYGGAVVHGLEGRIAERLHAVVHLEGAIPAPGASIMDGWSQNYRQIVLDQAKIHQGWLVPPPDPGMWTGLDESRQRWLRSRLTAQSLKTYQDIMPAGIPAFQGPHYYLWAEDRPTRPYQAIVRRFQGHPDWSVITTTGGHELPLTNPDAVMRVIEAAIRHAPLPERI